MSWCTTRTGAGTVGPELAEFLVLAGDRLPKPGDGGAEQDLVTVVRAGVPDALVELVLQVGVPLGERVAGNAGLKGERDDGQRAVGKWPPPSAPAWPGPGC